VDRLWQMKLYLQSTYGRVYLALMQEKEARAHREPCHVVVEVGDGTPILNSMTTPKCPRSVDL
jgi:hypothetical protein